jgi:hypothetical protein
MSWAFRRNISLPSSGLKTKQSKTQQMRATLISRKDVDLIEGALDRALSVELCWWCILY